MVGVGIIAGAFTVAGVLLTVIGTSVLDRRRYQREEAEASRQELVEACLAFITALDSFIYETVELGVRLDAGKPVDDRQLFRALQEIRRGVLRVRFIAPYRISQLVQVAEADALNHMLQDPEEVRISDGLKGRREECVIRMRDYFSLEPDRLL